MQTENADEENNIEILYEDDDALVVNKPAGLVVHADGRTQEPTLVDWFVAQYPDSHGVGEPIETSDGKSIARSGVVHRLDRETSGAIILCKTQDAFEYMKTQFKNREVEKIYVAFVHGELKHDEGEVDRPTGRSKNDFRKWTAERGTRGEMREAKTTYTVLARGEGYSYIEARPKTGRTHQIRVHMKAISHPIVCDKLYAPKKGCALGFDRLALHAKELQFMSLKGEMCCIEAALPKDFQKAQAAFAS